MTFNSQQQGDNVNSKDNNKETTAKTTSTKERHHQGTLQAPYEDRRGGQATEQPSPDGFLQALKKGETKKEGKLGQ
jgi:hypothetical protein